MEENSPSSSLRGSGGGVGGGEGSNLPSLYKTTKYEDHHKPSSTTSVADAMKSGMISFNDKGLYA